MNIFFDEDAQQLIMNAKKEMYDLKHPYVGTEHLLLAILKNSCLDITKKLANFGITYSVFRDELIKIVGIGHQSNDWFLFTPLLKNIINNATYYSKDNQKVVTAYSLFLSILREGDGVANRILLGLKVDLNALYDQFVLEEDTNLKKELFLINEFAINMNQESLMNKYNPVIGREHQINQIIQILLRKDKNNPLLIGEAGVGKTAIVEELSKRIANGDVPLKLRDRVIYNLPISSLVAGTKYRGEFEERVNKLLNEIKNNATIILFIDEIHCLVGAGGAEGAIDASNIFKPYLARGDLMVIGATTLEEYSKYIEKDKALNRRFQKVYVEEVNKEESSHILHCLRKNYESFHKVQLSDELLYAIYDFSNQFIPTGHQPDKCIDLLDEVCSYAALNENQKEKLLHSFDVKSREFAQKKNEEIIHHNFKQAQLYKKKESFFLTQYNQLLFNCKNGQSSKNVQMSDLYHVIFNKTGIPLGNLYQTKLSFLKQNLKKTVIGQRHIVKKFLDILANDSFLYKNEPLVFLFVGKNGVGKTFFVEKVIESGFCHSYLALNMNDYSLSNSLSKLTGAAPGYVGYNEFSVLKKISERPFTVLMLKDVDRACLPVLQFFISAFKNGFFELSNQEKISISHCLIFMTVSTSDTSLGFSNHNSSSFLDIIKNNTNYTFFFHEIGMKEVELYIKRYYPSIFQKESCRQLISQIVEESDYLKFGFKNIDSIVNRYLNDSFVNS